MKEKYELVEIETIVFDTDDVITLSCGNDTPDMPF